MTRPIHVFWHFLVLSALLLGTTAISSAAVKAGFVDHGVAASVAERRAVIAAADPAGNPVVIAVIQDNYNSKARNALLLTNPDTGETEQYFYPVGDSYAGDCFALILSKQGNVYVMFGGWFLEFSLEKREWTYAQNIGGLAMSFAEGPDGTIYVATYPNSRLYSFDPQTRKLTNYGQLDPKESYPYYLAVDKTGWVYAGIGTANSNLVAFNPATGERRQLAHEDERIESQGEVFLATDGNVYGRPSEFKPWEILSEGKRGEMGYGLPDNLRGPIRFGGMTGRLPSGEEITYYSTSEKYFVVAKRGALGRRVDFDYDSEGAPITSMVLGPDNIIYGSTSHPQRLYTYNPETDKLVDMGSMGQVSGGNVTNWDIQGPYLMGGVYNGGIFFKYDPTQPYRPETGIVNNPQRLARVGEPIARPRTVLAHSDGRHVLMGGFAGYGYVGGALLIYDIESDKQVLMMNEDLLPGHSIVTLKELPDGNLVGGTSVEAPGGGHPTQTNARLFIMDWETKEIIFDTQPVPGQVVFGRTYGGTRSVESIVVGADGLVYGVTIDATFFVFDPVKREIIHRESISKYGSPVRTDQVFVQDENGVLYGLMNRTLVQFDYGTFAHRAVVELPEPATAGTVWHNGRLYYATGSHVWSWGQ